MMLMLVRADTWSSKALNYYATLLKIKLLKKKKKYSKNIQDQGRMWYYLFLTWLRRAFTQKAFAIFSICKICNFTEHFYLFLGLLLSATTVTLPGFFGLGKRRRICWVWLVYSPPWSPPSPAVSSLIPRCRNQVKKETNRASISW